MANRSEQATSYARFPGSIKDTNEFLGFVSEQVCKPYAPPLPFIETQTKLLTLGSCFSGNVAKALKQNGFDVTNFNMSERIFSTFALKDFFAGVQNGTVSDDFIDGVEENAQNVASIGEILASGCTIILTLGLSMCWFNKETGEIVHNLLPGTSGNIGLKGAAHIRKRLQEHEMRHTSIEDNRNNLRDAISAIKSINPKNKIIITLSPIPMHICSSDVPILTADFMSKSVLRLAIREIEEEQRADVFYFPSFEIVRWAAPHFPGAFWGTSDTDGDPRHIDPGLIRMIVQMFVDNYVENSADVLAKL